MSRDYHVITDWIQHANRITDQTNIGRKSQQATTTTTMPLVSSQLSIYSIL